MGDAFPRWPWLYAARESSFGLCEFAVLVVLGLHANQYTGEAFPGPGTLAREARLSERRVFDALRTLEAAGVIVRLRRGRWRLDLRALQASAREEGASDVAGEPDRGDAGDGAADLDDERSAGTPNRHVVPVSDTTRTSNRQVVHSDPALRADDPARGAEKPEPGSAEDYKKKTKEKTKSARARATQSAGQDLEAQAAVVWKAYQVLHPRAGEEPTAKDGKLIAWCLAELRRTRKLDPEACGALLIDLLRCFHLAPETAFWRGEGDGKARLGIGTLCKQEKFGDRVETTLAWVDAGRPEQEAQPDYASAERAKKAIAWVWSRIDGGSTGFPDGMAAKIGEAGARAYAAGIEAIGGWEHASRTPAARRAAPTEAFTAAFIASLQEDA